MTFKPTRNKIAVSRSITVDNELSPGKMFARGSIVGKGATVIDQFEIGSVIYFDGTNAAHIWVEGVIVDVIDDADVLGIVTDE